jgi:hypothetical protein
MGIEDRKSALNDCSLWKELYLKSGSLDFPESDVIKLPRRSDKCSHSHKSVIGKRAWIGDPAFHPSGNVMQSTQDALGD